jgi:3',5'-cyclic AMP phosphodiesterase CpdA
MPVAGPEDVDAPEPPPLHTADGYRLGIPWHVLRRLLAHRGAFPRAWYRAGSPWLAGIRRLRQLTRRARRIGTLRHRRTGWRLPVFRATSRGRSYRIVARQRGQRLEVAHIGPSPSMEATGRSGGWLDREVGEQGETPSRAKPSPVHGRILWPALGFPAVVTPSERPSSFTMRDGDATKCICVLVLTNRRELSKAEAARYLRYVPWPDRGRRHIPAGAAGSFAEVDLTVRNDVRGSGLTMQNRKDAFGEHIAFGGNGSGNHGVVGNLAHYVRSFYRNQGLAHLHEIRVSEAASARLQDGLYHLFWNNEATIPSAPSDEMRLLLNRFAIPRRTRLGKGWEAQRNFLIEEYEYEYGGIHSPYRTQAKRTPAEILHPVFVERRKAGALRIGHVTDTHVDVRADVYEHNLRAARAKGVIAKNKGDFNNFNKSFAAVYDHAKQDSDIVLLTGDLIDYGRGHWGVGQPGQLQEDGSYHVDRNWFLFSYLIATEQAYTKPVYTILGNHDWRVNPYPPFAPGAPSPNELLHDHARLTLEEQKQIIAVAHGPGHQRAFSYTVKAQSAWQLAKERTGDALKTLVKLFSQTSKLEKEGFPVETTVESVAWYLLSINPFFDYAFTHPRRQSVLMLDWAEDENVLFPRVVNGKEGPYDPLAPGSAAGTPRARNCLTPLQQRLAADFVAGPSKAKVVGIHTPVIGPYGDWYDSDLLKGTKTYSDRRRARGPDNGHPLMAFRPNGAPHGMAADRGSFANGREPFIKLLANPKHSVRLVVSGHIHRNGLFVAYPSPKKVYVATPKDMIKERLLSGVMLVRGVVQQAVRAARPPATTLTPEGKQGPLYVNTTSAGPRGSFEQRPLTEAERARGGITVEPGYAHLELASDGTINTVEFRPGVAQSTRLAVPTRARELELESARW